MESNSESHEEAVATRVAMGLSMGMTCGAAFGAAWGNVALGVSFGAVNAFATDFVNTRFEGDSHFAALAHAVDSLTRHDEELDN